MKNVTLSVCFLATSISFSYAGNMGENSVHTSSFDGLYAGLGTGFATFFTGHQVYYPQTIPSTGQNDQHLNMTESGVLFDGHIGYGKQIFSHYYLGIKASVDYTPIQQVDNITFYSKNVSSTSTTALSGNNIFATSVKPIYNINGLLGTELLPRWLGFVEAGVSFSEEPTRANLSLATITSPFQAIGSGKSFQVDDGYQTGYNVGLGSRYKLSEHLMLSGELLYNSLGQYQITHVVNQKSSTTQRNYQLVSLFGSISYLL